MHTRFRLTLGMLTVALAALVLAQPGLASTADTVHTDSENDLIQAAQAAGVSINTTEMVELFRDGVELISAPIQGLETVPATELPDGVDVGFIHLDAPGTGIPAGHYTVRARSGAGGVTLGENDVTVDFVDGAGNVVASQQAVADVWSETVPSDPPYANTVAGTALGMPNPPVYQRTIRIWYFCPNGWIILIEIELRPY